MSNRLTGTILWYSQRDSNGIAVSDNREYYIDSSVIACDYTPKRGDRVSFKHNKSITDCLCGRDVVQI